MASRKYHVCDIADLKKYLKDESLTLKDIARKMDRTIPSIQQKLTEIAVDQIRRGADIEEVKKNLRARDEDIELLMNIENPYITRVRELLIEINDLMKKIK